MFSGLYQHSLALLTDLYQLTMAYGYWKSGMAERRAAFHLSFRSNPFGSSFAIACGLQYVVDFLRDCRVTQDDADFLAGLPGADGKPLFEPDFLGYLTNLDFCCDVDGIPEGTAVFAHEPLLRVQGPLLQCQIIETALLNAINFQTLIATKAARICRAACGEPVLEFGLRRAQGADGGLAASRAAYVGGCTATSNVLAGKLFGIPVKGTHAHSWVMAFGDEQTAFEAYAQAMPNNCIFLVDTYNTETGVQHALAVARELRRQGHEMSGIRLDSGDLATLSQNARRALDEAGFQESFIVATNDLDEHEIAKLKQRGARISVWGVGTRLATAFDQPALGGVYKLSALRRDDGEWQYTLKLSEEEAKSSTPGIQQLRRYLANDGRFVGDVVFDEPTGPPITPALVPVGSHQLHLLPEAIEFEDLLVPVFRDGEAVYMPPSASEARSLAMSQLGCLDSAILRLDSPESYLTGLEERLFRIRTDLVAATKERSAV